MIKFLMFNFLCNSLLRRRSSTVSTACFLRSFSVISGTVDSTPHSFTVEYLVKSFGFSLESALSASKRVHFETSEEADSVLDFLKNNGFSNSQALVMIKAIPNLLLSRSLKSISPKLEFLLSKGLSTSEIAKIVSSNPSISKRSLERCIIPGYNFLKNYLQSDEKTIACIRRYSYFLSQRSEKRIEISLNALRSVGVPESNIIYYLHYQPRMYRNPYRMREAVEAIKNMGFNPLRVNFMEALLAVHSMSKSTWARKVNAYKKWGWSEEDVLAAFRSRPRCLAMSEDKIMASMDYFVNKMGWNAKQLVESTILLTYSLDVRVKPRASVLQFLFQRGLLLKYLRSCTPYKWSDQLFLQRAVHPYLMEAPQLLKIYELCFDSHIQEM